MNRFKFSNYKLPHMAPFNNNKAESPKIKNPKTAQEEQMAEAKKAFRRISQKPLLEPKPLHPNSVAKQTVSSAGTATDSIRSIQAFKDEVKNYMDRTHKFKGTPYERPLSPEENFREAMGELSGKYFDLEKGKLRGYPTDDAEIIDEGFKSKLKSYQIFNPEMFSDQQPKDE